MTRITPALFEGLDLNSERDREAAHSRVVEAYADVADEDLFAEAKALKPYGRLERRWEATRAITDHHVEQIRRVEPPMETFRKVRAGWYTLAIVSLDEALADWKAPEHLRKVEEYVDVSKEKYGDCWVVSHRGGRDSRWPSHELNQDSLFRSVHLSFAEAKRYAVALKAYLQNKGPHPDWLEKVFSAERQAAFEAKMEGILGEPYADWAARQLQGGRAG